MSAGRLEARFVEFVKRVIQGVPDAQEMEAMRTIFFAGAASALGQIREICGPPSEFFPPFQMAQINDLAAEIREDARRAVREDERRAAADANPN